MTNILFQVRRRLSISKSDKKSCSKFLFKPVITLTSFSVTLNGQNQYVFFLRRIKKHLSFPKKGSIGHLLLYSVGKHEISDNRTLIEDVKIKGLKTNILKS